MVNASMLQSKVSIWYVCRLSPQPCTCPHSVRNTLGAICHAFSSSITCSSILTALASLVLTCATAFGQLPPGSVLVPPPTGAPVTQPNKRIYKPRPNAPQVGDWDVRAAIQTADGKLRHLRGHAEMENVNMLFRADEIDYDEDTGEVHARGSVY